MNLHGNAALSWSGRRRLGAPGCRAGLDAGGGGRGRRCQRALRAEVGWPLPRGGDRACATAPRRPGGSRTAPLPERVAVIVKLRRLRMTAAEIAETLAMPLSTVSGILTRLGHGQARPARARAGCPLRALTAGRARPRRRQEARPDRRRRRPARRGGRQHCNPGTPTPPAADAGRSAGSSSTSPSTTTAASPTPKCSPDEKAVDRCRLPAPSGRLLPPLRHPRRAAAHR